VERALRQTQEARERQKLDRQLKATNDELQHRLRDLTAILATGRAVISITDQRQLFERILDSALQLAEADICWLMLREERSNSYLLRAHRNLPEAWAKKMNQPVDDGISSLVALSGEGLVMSGAPLQKFKIATLGKSVGVIPIKIQNEVIGLLIVVRKNDREVAQDTQTLLAAIADYASISLVSARLFRALEESTLSASTGEKNRRGLFEFLRNSVREEVQAASYPLNHLISEAPGALNVEQRKALEAVQAALQRLTHASEKSNTSELTDQKPQS